MKKNAIVGIIGHFDNETDIVGLEGSFAVFGVWGLPSVLSAGAARQNVREFVLAWQVSPRQVEHPSPMQWGGLLESEQLMPGDDVIPAKPRCRDESEVNQKMGQTAAPTCAATLSEIEQSCMRV